MQRPPIGKLAMVAVCAVVLLSIAACQTKKDLPAQLSLDEAKQITSSFTDSFTVPAKGIDDIFELLDRVEYIPEICQYFTLPSPEEVRDVMNFSRLPYRAINYASGIATEQFYKGNIRLSIKYMQWAIAEVPFHSYGAAPYLAKLAAFHAYAGEYDKSENILAEAMALQSDIKQYQTDSRQRVTLIDFHIAESEGGQAAARGNLIEAEAFYRKALEIGKPFSNIVIDAKYDFAELELARTILRQGRLQEAESILRERLNNGLPLTTHVVAVTLLLFSETLYEQGRYFEAERLARATVKMFAGNCTSAGNLQFAGAREVLAKILVAQEKWDEALIEYKEIRNGLTDDPGIYERLFSGSLSKALALLRLGRLEESGDVLRNALAQSERRLGSGHYETVEIRGFLAMIQFAEGKQKQALNTFDSVIENLLMHSRDAGAEGDTLRARDQRLKIILESYMRLLIDLRGAGSKKTDGLDVIAKMFRLAEAIRSRTVQRALAASGARALIKDKELSELARLEQDTQKRISALYGTLSKELSRQEDAQSSSRLANFRATIGRLRSARAVLIGELEKRFPNYAELINPKPLTIDRAQAILRPGEAMISTYVGEQQTYVWAFRAVGEPVFAVVDLGHADLAAMVGLVRVALEPKPKVLGDIPPFDVKTAHALYAALLAPVAAGWREAKHLIVLANGPLAYLPFQLLVTKPTALPEETAPLFSNYKELPWLGRRYGVTTLPAAGSLKLLRSLPKGTEATRTFVGFGDPVFNAEQAKQVRRPKPKPRPGKLRLRGAAAELKMVMRAAPDTEAMSSATIKDLPRLPETAEEIRQIARALNADPIRDVFAGRQASEARVKTMKMSNVKILAFATHGLVPGDLDGLVEPALALTPSVVNDADDNNEDGLLTMGEILSLKLNADWVVLSACNTGADRTAGADAVAGLGRAFFYAGARALLVTNWPVETMSSKLLTTKLFDVQSRDPSLPRSEALRRARVRLINGLGFIDSASGEEVFSYAHPIFWAAFDLVGDGGRTNK